MVNFDLNLKALANELTIDSYDQHNVYKELDIKVNVIRPIKSIHRFKKVSTLQCFIRLMSRVWGIIFTGLLAYKAFKYIFLYVTHKRSSERISLPKSILIGTSHRVIDMIKRIDDDFPNLCLSVPWVKLKTHKELNYVSIFEIIGIKDILLTIIDCYKGVYNWSFTIEEKEDILQSYVLFEYFLFERCLIEIREKSNVESFWYSNHYDRWSVLIDHYVKKKTVLLQHGLLNENLSFEYKSQNVGVVYSFNTDSFYLFKKNIIVGVGTECRLYKPYLDVVSIPDSSNSVLIISRPIQLPLDIFLTTKLLELGLDVYIKAHPLYDKTPYLNAFSKKKGCHMINDDQFFPNVKYVISGRSTLALEYELIGSGVIYLDKLDTQEIVHYFKELKRV